MSYEEPERPPIRADSFAYLSFLCTGISIFVLAIPLTFVAVCLGTTAIRRATLQETSKQVPIAAFAVGVLGLVVFSVLHSGLVYVRGVS